MKGSGPEDHGKGAESLAESEPVDEVPATLACPERFLRRREVAPLSGQALGWYAEVIAMMSASKERASQSSSDLLGILHWVMERRACLPSSGLLRKRAPPPSHAAVGAKAPGKILQIWPTLTTAIERTLPEKDVWRCCVRGYLFTPTERTSLVKTTWNEESAFLSGFSVGGVI